MKDKEILILTTRPLDEAVIEKAAFQQVVIDTIPFIEINRCISSEVSARIVDLSTQNATVVFTSVNAVEIVVDAIPTHLQMPAWNIYCIGGATFTLIKKYWPFESVLSTAKNATGLAKKIIEDGLTHIHFFCGNKRLEELPDLLKQQNIGVDELVVYSTVETPAMINRTYDGILFFSPSAVNSFFSNNSPSKETTLFAIGHTTAEAIKQFSANSIIVSDFPAKDQLVDKMLRYYHEKKYKE